MLGIVHPRVLLKQLDAKELSEWLAFYKLCRFGPDLDHFMLAQLAAMQSGKKAARPLDFLPWMEAEPQTEREIHSIMEGVLNGCSRDSRRDPSRIDEAV